jgi:hypothetical protein
VGFFVIVFLHYQSYSASSQVPPKEKQFFENFTLLLYFLRGLNVSWSASLEVDFFPALDTGVMLLTEAWLARSSQDLDVFLFSLSKVLSLISSFYWI